MDEEKARTAARLAERIAAGEGEAEEELVARFGDGLMYMLRHLTRDPAWAEDLRQETFAVALEKLRAGELRDPGKLAAFLRGIARNLTRAGFRRRRRSPMTEPPSSASRSAHPEETPALDPPDRGPGPLRRLLASEEARLAEELLQQLPSPRDREVLLRFCVGEEDRGSICTALGLSRPQLNLILFRARKRFQAMYEAARKEPASRGGKSSHPGGHWVRGGPRPDQLEPGRGTE